MIAWQGEDEEKIWNLNTSMKVWKELFKLSNHPKGQNLTQIIFLIHVQNHLTNS